MLIASFEKRKTFLEIRGQEKEFSKMAYCVLEVVGISREEGVVSVEVCKKLKIEAKDLFAHFKRFLVNNLMFSPFFKNFFIKFYHVF